MRSASSPWHWALMGDVLIGGAVEIFRAWIANPGRDPGPFKWIKTGEEILDYLADYLAKITRMAPTDSQNQLQT